MVRSRLDPPPPPPGAYPSIKYVVHFKDDGQDFLRWFLDADGRVLRSEPFQTWLWKGCTIVNLRQLRIWADNEANHPGIHEKPYAFILHSGNSENAVQVVRPVINFEVH